MVAQVRENIFKSLDRKQYTVTLYELKNVVNLDAQLRETFCKSLDWQPCTLTVD
jgi:hypothetical protein